MAGKYRASQGGRGGTDGLTVFIYLSVLFCQLFYYFYFILLYFYFILHCQFHYLYVFPVLRKIPQSLHIEPFPM